MTPPPPRAATRRRPRRPGEVRGWVALAWLGPSLLLIAAVVVYPAYRLLQASRSRYSITGLFQGDAGWKNYVNVLQQPALRDVLINTAIWVVCVVAAAMLISLALAQLLIKEFPGRRLVRMAIIVPWAASLLITSQLFVLLYDYNYGLINHVLIEMGLLDTPIDFLGDPAWTMTSMIAVGVFVSLPFTTFVFIAGLNTIPDDVVEAGIVDGATAAQRYRYIILPLLRPALVLASALNIIFVFNSFPVIYTLNDRNPGYDHDTTITYMYKLAFKSAERDVGMSAAMGVLNVVIILVVVAVYLRLVHWQKDDA